VLEIAKKKFGDGAGCLIIGEVAQAHDGSLGAAHAYIDAIAAAGADAVKFQTHIASAETTPAEPWRVKFSSQDATRYDYWKRMEFSEEQWCELAKHAQERNVIFLSSPFSMEALELLERVGVPAWKVASGEVGNLPMLDRMAGSSLPVLISTGMSPLSEIDAAVERIRGNGAPLAVMQCTSSYPCPPERVGLNLISFYRERYGCPVGLSDHSGTIYPGLAAAAEGIAVLEVHATLSRESFGPDVPVSVTVEELRQLSEGVRFIEKMRANEIDKDEMAREMEGMRGIFTKSVVARTDLESGATLREGDLIPKKPGTGIPAARLGELIGRRLRRSVKADEILQEDDIHSMAEK
jgi:N-acetylneuraminate synthase